MGRILQHRGFDNAEFFKRYGAAGRIGLVGGVSALDRGIRRAQRLLDPARKPSRWSHAFVFQGERADGRPWVLESDFDTTGGRLRSGAQENRLDKYLDDAEYPNAGVLDFALGADDVRKLLGAGLELVSNRTPYALTGAMKTYWAMLRKSMDGEKDRDEIFCSALVRSLYRHVGLDLVPGVAVRHTTPEHLARCVPPHVFHVLLREE